MMERLNQLKELGWGVKEISELLEELKADMEEKRTNYQGLSLEKKIINFVNDLCIPCKLKGRDYIIEGIKYIMCNKNSKTSKDLYPYLATLFNTKPARVKRAIRHVLVHLFESKTPLFMQIFSNTINGYNGGRKITNSQFFYGAARYLEENS